MQENYQSQNLFWQWQETLVESFYFSSLLLNVTSKAYFEHVDNALTL